MLLRELSVAEKWVSRWSGEISSSESRPLPDTLRRLREGWKEGMKEEGHEGEVGSEKEREEITGRRESGRERKRDGVKEEGRKVGMERGREEGKKGGNE